MLLAPGTLFVSRARLARPVAKVSTTRELATVGMISAASDLLAVALLALIRIAVPSHTPDLGRLVRERGSYVEVAYAQLSLWAVMGLLIACAVGFGSSVVLSTDKFQRALDSGRLAGLFRPQGDIRIVPAWWEMFKGRSEQVHVACQLDDGTFVSGFLLSFSGESDEIADRDLVLGGPLFVRPPGQDEGGPYDASALVLSARRMQFLAVTYVAGDNKEEDAA